MNKKVICSISIIGVLLTLASCAKKSIMDKSIYEDLTAKEVISINDTLPSFRLFYDNIRATIVANSSEIEKEDYKTVTYNDMYKLIHYWSSTEYLNLIESSKQSYNEDMARCQVKIDSVADYYRIIIDSLKFVGNTSYPSYETFVKEIVPEAVFEYMSAQEGSDLSIYIAARNKMIVDYVNPGYTGAESYLYRLIEFGEMEDQFLGQTTLYNLAKYHNEKATDAFESYIGKYSYTADEWVPKGLQLPINYPNGNYIRTEYRYSPFTTGLQSSPNETFNAPSLVPGSDYIMKPGVTYVTTSSRKDTDEFGLKVYLTMEFTIYNDGTASGNLIETDAEGLGTGYTRNHPIEGTWKTVSKHDKRFLKLRLILEGDDYYNRFDYYVDEDLNCYANDINTHPVKLRMK